MSKQQSAMEYLMTYGWSILIIAIVLAALFSLGVFGSSNLGPRAQPNSCRVYRPNGPGTTTNINLEGVCDGELPLYVAQFNGASSYISTGTTSLPLGNNPESFFAWIYFTGTTSGTYPIYVYGAYPLAEQNTGLVIGGSANDLYFYPAYDDFGSTLVLTANAWHFVGYVYSAGASNTVTMYLDGKSQTSSLPDALSVALPGSDPSDIGKISNGYNYYFQGSIADVQVYNVALDANAVQALYLDGIGSAPVEPQGLVGWWPLNGDTNDYSGDGNNGASTNVIFTSSWTNGYTAP